MIADLLQERRDKKVAKARAETAKAVVRIAELEKLLELAREDNARGDDE